MLMFKVVSYAFTGWTSEVFGTFLKLRTYACVVYVLLNMRREVYEEVSTSNMTKHVMLILP